MKFSPWEMPKEFDDNTADLLSPADAARTYWDHVFRAAGPDEVTRAIHARVQKTYPRLTVAARAHDNSIPLVGRIN